MTDQEFIDAIAAVRYEAIRRWGEKPVMKHGPMIGSEVTVIDDSSLPWENESGTYIYTQAKEDEAVAANINTGWVWPRWQEYLEPLLPVDENAIELLHEADHE